MKICCNCKIEKSLDEFGGIKVKRNRCKECYKILDKKYREQNREKRLVYNRQWKKDNAEKAKSQRKTWRENNREKRNDTEMAWYWENRDKVRGWQKRYYSTPEYREKVSKNPATMWRQLLRRVLSQFGKKKENRTIDLLGYSAIELKEHLEKLFLPGMSWDNRKEWHIDHIRPVSSFPMETPINIVNALNNLQPLWAKDNLKKSKKYNYAKTSA